MPATAKGQELLDKMMQARGFVWPAFELLCEMDPELIEHYEGMKNYVLGKKQEMPEHLREIFISVAIAVRHPADTEGLKEHVKRALKLGAAPRQVLEAFESIFPPCGMMVLIAGCNALKRSMDELGLKA